MASFPQAFPPTPCAPLYPPPYAPHALPISFVSISPPAQYRVRSTDYRRKSLRTSEQHSEVNKVHPCTGTEVKVNVTLVQVLRLCTGRKTHRRSRGIALPFHDHGIRRGWGVSVTSRPLFTLGKDPVPTVQEPEWAPGPVWTVAENLTPTGIRPPDRPARRQSLYRLGYPTHNNLCTSDNTFTIHVPSLIAVEVLIHVTVLNECSNVCRLNQYVHGHVRSWTVAFYQIVGAVENALTVNHKTASARIT